MPTILIPMTLTWNSATVAELAGHELTVEHAIEVFEHDPEFFSQPPLGEISSRGRFQVRPQRVRMVGPTGTGRMLTFILEMPDGDLASHVVTGWESDLSEIERYYATS